MTSKGSALSQNTNYLLRYAQHTSLVPFLYQTRTLQRLREKQRKAVGSRANSQSCSSFSTTSYVRAASEDIPFEEGDTSALAGPVQGRPRSSRVGRMGAGARFTPHSRTRETAPPSTQDLRENFFPSPFPDIFQESLATPRQPRQSTITAAEHAVFSRIFANLGAKDAPNAALEDDSLNDELEANSDPDAYLDRIFEAAIRTSSSRQSEPTAEDENEPSKHTRRVRPGSALTFVESFETDPGVISRYPLSLREAAAQANKERMKKANYAYRPERFRRGADDESVYTIEHLEDGYTEYDRKVYRARRNDRRKVQNMLEKAETDVEIWRVLEEEVFSTVVRFQEQLKAEEDKDRAAKKAAKKKRKGETAREIDAEVTEPEALSKAEKLDEQVPLLAILETNYADHCLYALRQLRKYFRNSPYALTLLPKIKSLGPISYVLGTSTDLYNELMFIKWREYSDLHGISELGTEMRNRGLAVNQLTLEVLRAVLLLSKQGAKGKHGEVVREWWDLQGSVAGVAKVSGLYGRLWSDYLEKQAQADPGRGTW